MPSDLRHTGWFFRQYFDHVGDTITDGDHLDDLDQADDNDDDWVPSSLKELMFVMMIIMMLVVLAMIVDQ